MAPIVIFAFNRPDHLSRTLDALTACPEAKVSNLYIYCDGPRGPEDLAAVEEVLRVANNESRFKSCRVFKSDKNKGLARSIIDGVTQTIAEFGKVIVLEDDMVVSKGFLRFMNSALDKYESASSVASVCAYMYPIDPKGLPDTFFLKGTDCWGWATWKRAWDVFDPNGERLLKQITAMQLEWEFDLDGAYPYVQMLRDQIAGRNNSWAIRWHASAYLKGMYSFFPKESLVQNIGLDGSGTHCGTNTNYQVQLSADSIFDKFPEQIEENVQARERISKFLLNTRSLSYRFVHGVKKLFIKY
jgi:hypothetical protein